MPVYKPSTGHHAVCQTATCPGPLYVTHAARDGHHECDTGLRGRRVSLGQMRTLPTPAPLAAFACGPPLAACAARSPPCIWWCSSMLNLRWAQYDVNADVLTRREEM
ncbi:hypothetical protein HPB50_016651 [Hyalomma asiaticum]|uniref:Uncharacterized protein n=1 Tax=Hyalomma asiaticum TaxID=266040 RepID=A0ACB7TJB9_HYAAI|nr:hypothetical protein HPB50_016651 [Hyalomma asiaticum]